MTYSYICHLWNLRPANLLGTERINFMRPQHVRMTRDHIIVWFLLTREPDRISAQTSFCQTLESLSKICTADSMCLSLLVFTQLFSEVARSQPAKPARKQNLTQSRSFKVKHFGITEKPTTDCISACNNAGLISKASEKIAIENAKNCRCRQPHCRLTPLPRIFVQILYRQELVIGLQFCRW